MEGQDLDRVEEADPRLGQLGPVPVIDPDRFQARQEALATLVGKAQEVEVGDLVAHEQPPGPHLPLGDRDFLEQDVVALRPQSLVEAQVNAGKRHPQIVIEGASDLDQLLVQHLRAEHLLQIGRDVEHDRDGEGEVGPLLARLARLRLRLLPRRRHGRHTARGLARLLHLRRPGLAHHVIGAASASGREHEED